MDVDGKFKEGGGGGGGEEGELETSKMKEQVEAGNKASSDASNKMHKGGFWMSDVYRGYYGGFANIAWAHAVKNKPLLLDLNNNNNKTADVIDSDNNYNDSDTKKEEGEEEKEEEEEVASEIEEGELEEGEIDGEFEQDTNKSGNNGNDHHQHQQQQHYMEEMGDEELEVQVSSIRKVLENVTVSDAHKSFDIVCARLRSSLESLRELVLHTWFPSKDALIQQAYSAITSVYSVFTSMTPDLKDHNKDKFSRLLTFVISLSSVLFTPDQKKEVEAMVSIVSPPPPPPAPSKPKPRVDRQEELPIINKAILTDSNILSINASDNTSLDSSVDQSDQRRGNILSNALRQFSLPSNIKTRGSFGPLLDLHKVHDEDSLPSPTGKTPPSLPFFGTAAPRPVHALPISNVHPYETEAVNAISSYNQKFMPNTFYSQDTLPSPTPSEEGTTAGADDSNEEVSSFSDYNTVKNTDSSPPVQPIVSSVVTTSTPSLLVASAGVSAGPLSYASNPASRHPGKSRDPRLSHLNYNSGVMDLSFYPPPVTSSASNLEAQAEGMNPKKSKASEVPVLGSPATKRQRNGLETDNKVQSLPGSIGLDSSRILGLQAATRGGPVMDPRRQASGVSSYGMNSVNPSPAPNMMAQSIINGSTAESLQSLLKGMPAAVLSIMKEQKRSTELFQNLLHPANSKLLEGQATLPITAPATSSGGGQTTLGLPQAPSQIAVKSSQEDTGKPCLKPRDPRRALQLSAIQRSVATVSEQPKVNGTNMNVADSQTSMLPDIATQFTKNLLNIADIVSVSPQTSSIQPSVPISSPQSLQVNLDRVTVKSGGPEKTADRRTGSLPRPEEVVPGRVQSQNHWGDVEHLFEGYDDQQRAAIQQERARRIDEQKKMFAAHKLCLVLDLDHTLLNSAKFTEVDPVHDEILRKKEEQDREKPRRHLFRFPHMGMWTKLRPGVWNFLEKASKLYELHLYTMGNKLYANEMAKVLDPKGSLFAGRVISRGDDGDLIDGDERVPKSKDLDGVLGMESAVVIIDDSVRVWPHNKLNLIVVERYTYFPCSRRQFGLPGPSLLEIDHDERPEEGTLASSLAVIERIHQNFFANKSLDDVDVRNILASEQRKILGGCRIVFSRVFPVGEASPHLHPLWQTAEQFGAVCTNQMDEQVTHVVANSLGTDKVNWALSNGKFVVHPGWVEASALLYRRANEQDFAIKS